MPGAIHLDADTIRPPTNIAYKDEADNWRAGPDAKGYEKGQFVEAAYAKQARGIRKNANMVKQIMRWNDVNENQARKTSHTIREKLKDAESEDERREIWKQYVDSP